MSNYNIKKINIFFRFWKESLFVAAVILIKLFDKSCITLTPTSSSPEVHSLVCKKHLYFYLLAIKSFLSFNTSFYVVIHDDGSLTKKEIKVINKHIIGCRIILQSEADKTLASILKRYPRIVKYREQYVNAKQILDFFLLSKSKKIIGLDSDILFFKQPHEIYDWSFNVSKSIFYSFEKDSYGPNMVNAFFGCQPYLKNINIGLMGGFSSLISLPFIEEKLSMLKNDDWWTGQMLLSILIPKLTIDFFPLPSSRYICRNLRQKAVMKHYFLSHGVRYEYILDIICTIKRLNKLFCPSFRS